MRIGVPREIKNHEYRVGLTPAGALQLVENGHEVWLETNAGYEVGLDDAHYESAGARIVLDPEELFAGADLIVKVKEPQPVECAWLREGQVLFTYLHLAPDPEQTKLLRDSGCVAIAYETVTDARGRLPLLAPMSEVAGRVSVQAGAHCLEKMSGGAGVLMGGVPGTPPAKVVIVGGGVAGTHAARMAAGMEADVTVLDISLERLRELSEEFGGRVRGIHANPVSVAAHAEEADLVIGAVLVPGASAPKVLFAETVRRMRRGSAVVDISIDQGGCFETSHPTTHDDPTYEIDGVIHYCVANIPGCVARTSTFALTNATFPFVVALTNCGWREALDRDAHLCNGLNVCRGEITHRAVADSLGETWLPASRALAA